MLERLYSDKEGGVMSDDDHHLDLSDNLDLYLYYKYNNYNSYINQWNKSYFE